MNHKIARPAFALAVGLLVAYLSYNWITNPVPRMEREMQEAVVAAAREHLAAATGIATPEIVDPIAVDRKVGKAYIYRSGDGWEVSGYYRRDEDDAWHPFLMALDSAPAMTHLKVEDAALAEQAEKNALLEVLP